MVLNKLVVTYPVLPNKARTTHGRFAV